MKRKASNALGTECPAKISKDPTDGLDSPSMNSSVSTEATIESALTSPRVSSARQRKAPAWLASYVTDGSTAVKESTKSAKSSISTLDLPVKTKGSKSLQQRAEEDIDGQVKSDEDTPALRRGSTLKVEDSPPRPSKNKKLSNTFARSSSLVRNDTQILNSPKSDSSDSATESKDTKLAGMKSFLPNRLVKSPMSQASKFSNSSSSPSQNLSEVTAKVPSNQHILSQSSIHVLGVDAEEFKSSNVVEVCATKSLIEADTVNVNAKAANTSLEDGGLSKEGLKMLTVVHEKPKMLEIVICISTSGAMRDYLTVLQERTRDLVWRLQSLIPDLRIGVLAHTQGGIHDDKSGSGRSAIDHNYIRTGGHSGTKWLDLGATFSQICAFVDSLGPEATIYPEYVQDNLEMALWKLQRCMSWSSCSYRTVIMIGRGRPNRTSFYLQREHWRGWIRSALEIGHKAEIPIVDWELEAKLLAQMGIHVFTIQASSPKTLTDEEEDEGSSFFRNVAEITNGLHIRLTDASQLLDIIVGVCCACHGPDLLQTHRDTLRDENDGVLPSHLKDVFVSLQLHSKRRSLSTIPSLVGDLSALKSQLARADANGNLSSSEEDETSGDERQKTVQIEVKHVNNRSSVKKPVTKSHNAKAGKKSEGSKQKVTKKNNTVPVKQDRKSKKLKSQTVKTGKVVKKAVKVVKKAVKVLKGANVERKSAKSVSVNKTTANKPKANKKVLISDKNNLNLKRQSVKGKIDKQVKVTTKKVQVKNKNLKVVTKAVVKKNTNIRAKTVPAASQKKNKKIENVNSRTESETQNVAKLPQAMGP